MLSLLKKDFSISSAQQSKLRSFLKYFLYLSTPIILFVLLYQLFQSLNAHSLVLSLPHLLALSVLSIPASLFFIIFMSTRFFFFKVLLGTDLSFSNFLVSFRSVLYASAFDLVTPAKLNDLARVKLEPSRSIAIKSIVLDRLLDISTLFSIMFISYPFGFLGFLFILVFLLLLAFLASNVNDKLPLFRRLLVCFALLFLSLLHWSTANFVFNLALSSTNGIMSSPNIISFPFFNIQSFASMTLVGSLPLTFGGFGMREVGALLSYKNISASSLIVATILYGIFVSGVISLLGLCYNWLRLNYYCD